MHHICILATLSKGGEHWFFCSITCQKECTCECQREIYHEMKIQQPRQSILVPAACVSAVHVREHVCMLVTAWALKLHSEPLLSLQDGTCAAPGHPDGQSREPPAFTSPTNAWLGHQCLELCHPRGCSQQASGGSANPQGRRAPPPPQQTCSEDRRGAYRTPHGQKSCDSCCIQVWRLGRLHPDACRASRWQLVQLYWEESLCSGSMPCLVNVAWMMRCCGS